MARLAIHPGEHLLEQLRALDMSAAEFARRVGVPTNRITELLNGKRNITADTALRLARAFNTSAHFWMNLQMIYDLRVAESGAAKRITKIEPIGRPPKSSARRSTPNHVH